MESPTIAAIATPPGSGGIGIIRVSGEGSLKILSDIFRKTGKRAPAVQHHSSIELQAHRMYLGHIIDPREKTLVDEVLVVTMRAPHSYTMEDVVEIQSHSGYIVLNKILKLVLAYGARLAEPGEFTRRAFMNGRIDLTQAEAVIDVINARTGKSLDIATEQLKGGIGKKIGKIRGAILSILADIEVDIDFSDDIGESSTDTGLVETLKTGAVDPLKQLIDAYEHNHYFRDGIRMAIIGRPNVGKSSLLNRLIRKERAIVTEIPGTTRDTIEEMVNINGLPVIVIDTAGLHETTQQIELMGIERTHATIQGADIVLLVIDLSQGVTREDCDIFQRLGKTKHIVVMNKVDVESDISLPREWEGGIFVKISALKGTNLDDLKDTIFNMGVGPHPFPGVSSLVPNLRQADGLKRAQRFALKALKGEAVGRELELTALDLGDAARELDKILGLRYSEDVLDLIFSRFCIGK